MLHFFRKILQALETFRYSFMTEWYLRTNSRQYIGVFYTDGPYLSAVFIHLSVALVAYRSLPPDERSGFSLDKHLFEIVQVGVPLSFTNYTKLPFSRVVRVSPFLFSKHEIEHLYSNQLTNVPYIC
jgi:hypothetical protein